MIPEPPPTLCAPAAGHHSLSGAKYWDINFCTGFPLLPPGGGRWGWGGMGGLTCRAATPLHPHPRPPPSRGRVKKLLSRYLVPGRTLLICSRQPDAFCSRSSVVLATESAKTRLPRKHRFSCLAYRHDLRCVKRAMVGVPSCTGAVHERLPPSSSVLYR